MRFYSDSDFQNLLGEKIGSGTEKICYLSKTNPCHCFKVGLKGNCSQIKREVDYFNWLKKKGIRTSFLPEYYGEFETETCVGYEQECVLEKKRGGGYDSVELLWDAIANPNNSMEEIEKELIDLKREQMETNVICGDFHGGNIYRVRQGNIFKLMIIDGVGVPEFIPISKMFRFFGKRKIERQWKKFEERRLKGYYQARYNSIAKKATNE